jgi:hypothetical protein
LSVIQPELSAIYFLVRYKNNDLKILGKITEMLKDRDCFCRKYNDALLWCNGLHNVSSVLRQRKEISWMLVMTELKASLFLSSHLFPSSPTALTQPVLTPYGIAAYLAVVANHTLVNRKTGREYTEVHRRGSETA